MNENAYDSNHDLFTMPEPTSSRMDLLANIAASSQLNKPNMHLPSSINQINQIQQNESSENRLEKFNLTLASAPTYQKHLKNIEIFTPLSFALKPNSTFTVVLDSFVFGKVMNTRQNYVHNWLINGPLLLDRNAQSFVPNISVGNEH